MRFFSEKSEPPTDMEVSNPKKKKVTIRNRIFRKIKQKN
jgi:hypothetical protein